MGLLSKAEASVAPGKGLLQRSLELLTGQPVERKKSRLQDLLITQPEVDRLYHERVITPPVLHKNMKLAPSEIPLTWAEAGMRAPSGLGGTIDESEYHKATKALKSSKKHEHVPSHAPSGVRGDPTEEIISRIFALPHGVELPSCIFSLIAERLSISKGALLLLDPARSVYAPWASTGFDPTTLHRLRIPPEMGESLGSAANGRPVIVGAEELSRYQTFFSSREFALITRLILVPFLAAEKLLAVLLIAAADSPFASDEDLLTCLERIAGASSPAVQKAREERFSGAPVEATAGTLEENLSDLIAAKPDAKMLFFSLSLEDFQKRILENTPHLDSFRLEEDVRFFMQRFARDLGRALSMGKSTYLIAIQSLEKKDLDLFLHQLRNHLGTLFAEPDGDGTLTPAAIAKVRHFPAEGDSIPGLVSFFST